MQGEEGPVVDLHWIFGGPIEAVIRANIMAAQAFVDFIKKDGFIDPVNGEMFGGLKMIAFSFEQPGGPDGLPVKRLFRVPWLSIIPLPLLEVKDATFEFGVCLLGAVPQDSGFRKASLLGDDEPPEPDDRPVTWRGMLARGKPNEANETRPDLSPHLAANMHAKVTVGQADIPAGIRNLLAIMGENAQVTSALLTAQPPLLEFGADFDRRPIPITLQAVTDARDADPPPSVTAYYDMSRISLSISGVAWASGEARSTDKSGRLEVDVGLGGEVAPGNSVTVLFRTEVEGAVAVSEVSCRVRLPMRRGAR